VTALDPVRLAVGTLTVLPVPAPTSVDRQVAGRAMILAPAVGALLGSGMAGVIWLCGLCGWSAAVSAALGLGFLVVATGAIHLDGLADTVDGLGGGRSAPAALSIMQRGDIGPFGVCSVVLFLLVQFASLDQAISLAESPAAVCIVALTTGRLSMPVTCSRWFPAARSSGLGSAVAGSVGPIGLVVATALALLVAGAVALAAKGPGLAQAAAVVLLGVAVAAGAVGIATRWLGGITGDVLGAVTELTTTIALLAAVAR
jgi:adenosylcobinamide-GDP ribazoletransferase